MAVEWDGTMAAGMRRHGRTGGDSMSAMSDRAGVPASDDSCFVFPWSSGFLGAWLRCFCIGGIKRVREIKLLFSHFLKVIFIFVGVLVTLTKL